ncbi:NAD kinase 2, mitochondrial [Plutella xylostella]|uniref:NAD kinase 2, mitochondrial n=1 Tax=Plutella xylostella TaxID=51655 RepID=UPI0018D1747B|nr:NAD kinase 2, mitochondrial [Plutella xylostella]
MSVLNNFTVLITRSLRGRFKQRKEMRDAFLPRVLSRPESTHADKPQLDMQKCLIVSKVTRYEYEKHSLNNISDSELERILRARGSDYSALVSTHREQKEFENTVAKHLQDMGLEVKMASRLTYNDDLLKWCDVVIPCGGDGTFLLAASRVRDANKPVIGFNSAPHKSVGRLCLPTWCSNDIRGALKALKEGRFSWMRRTRIRTTVTCDPNSLDSITPVDLHTLHYSRYQQVSQSHDGHDSPATHPAPSFECQPDDTNRTDLPKKVLPFLALNEVFIGESVTSRVSLLRLQIDRGQWTHTKSSGLCVTTGTGSTSWHFSINCLRSHSVLELMKTLSSEFHTQLDTTLESARRVAEKYNQKLMFAADSPKLAYSVREYITFEDWPTPRGLRVRDFATCVRVKSHCIDAGLVIDGSVSFPFNDGTEALLEVHPEDALMTVQMDENLPHH